MDRGLIDSTTSDPQISNLHVPNPLLQQNQFNDEDPPSAECMGSDVLWI